MERVPSLITIKRPGAKKILVSATKKSMKAILKRERALGNVVKVIKYKTSKKRKSSMARKRKHHRNPSRRRHRRSNPSMKILGMKPLTLLLLGAAGYWIWSTMRAAKAMPALPAQTPALMPAGDMMSVMGDTMSVNGGIFESAGGMGSLS